MGLTTPVSLCYRFWRQFRRFKKDCASLLQTVNISIQINSLLIDLCFVQDAVSVVPERIFASRNSDSFVARDIYDLSVCEKRILDERPLSNFLNFILSITLYCLA